MSNKEFIDKIIEEYVASRNLTFGNGGYDIERGMSHSTSGKAEDLFALYLARRLNDPKLKFLVDKPISFKPSSKQRTKTFKPDVAIIKNGVLTNYFDLKMDLGWNRDISQYLKDKNDFVQELKRQQNAWYTMQLKPVYLLKFPKI